MTTMCMTETVSNKDSESRPSSPGGILVGIDFSPESLAALEVAAGISRRKNLPLHALAMIPAFPKYQINPGVSSSQKNVEQLRIELKMSELADLMARLDSDTSWTTECRIGRPVRGLIEVAESRHAELIVVGRHHHGIIDTVLGNETTLHLMRNATVPVLSVGGKPEAPQNVVAAVDFSDASIAAARYALSLMEKGGTFHVCYVEPPAELLPEGFSLPYDDRFPGDIAEAFRGFAASLDAPDGIHVQCGVLTGHPAESLANYAARIDADLIALGSHGHSAVGRFILGSVSTAITKRAECGVLVAPPDWLGES